MLEVIDLVALVGVIGVGDVVNVIDIPYEMDNEYGHLSSMTTTLGHRPTMM